MLRRFALSVALLLSLAVTAAQAASVISAGADGLIELQPDMAGQEVQFMVSSPDNDPLQGVNFRPWIGDGGPVLGLPNTAPDITGIDLVTGTIFDGNATPQSFNLQTPQAWETTVTTTSGTVEANGVLATVTFDTTGHSGGSWQLFLDGVAEIGGTPIGFASTDWSGSLFPEGHPNAGEPVPEPAIPDFFTLQIEGTVIEDYPGDDWDNPILPDNESPPWLFTDVPGGEGTNPDGSTGLWFDPIVADGYIYETDGASNFVQVGLPPLVAVADDDGNYLVTRGDGGGSAVVSAGDFWNFDGVPQTEFTISGINPPVDGEDPTAFPTFLVFDELTNTFTMTPVPEPSSLALAGLGVLGLVGYGLRRRRSA